MGLRELLLQEALRPAEIRRESFGDALERRLRVALLHLDRQGGLVELRVARVVQRVLDIRILQEGRDERINDRVVGVHDLRTHWMLLFLAQATRHYHARAAAAN